MESSIKIVSVIEKVAKNGVKYHEVWCEIQLGARKFIRRFTIFQ